MIFDCSARRYFEVTLAADEPVVLAQYVVPGAVYVFDIAQDATGGHAFPWERSGSFDTAPPVSLAPLTRTSQSFVGTKYRTLAPVQNGAINQG